MAVYIKTQIPAQTFQAWGEFSKSDGGVQLSFCPSGCADCDVGCPHHPDSTHTDPTYACYAVRTENLRKNIGAKMRRHKTLGCAAVTRLAIAELERKRKLPTIARLSAFGTVPVNPSADDIDALRELLEVCQAKGLPVHFPVEGAGKSATYRASLGHLVAVRRSLYAESDLDTVEGPVSYSAGRPGQTRQQKMDSARAAAARRRAATGRRCVVCPAVQNHNIKCGRDCLVCPDRNCDVVYPLH